MTALAYAVICGALHYLAFWAKITRWLHSRYPPIVAEWAGCAACSGAWFGLFCGLVGCWLRLDFLGLPGRSLLAILAAGAWGMITTPMVSSLHLAALERLEEVKRRAWGDDDDATTPAEEDKRPE